MRRSEKSAGVDRAHQRVRAAVHFHARGGMSKVSEMNLDETYQFESGSSEAREAMDDIDAFERRLRGEEPAARKPVAVQKENRPKKPVVKGSHYVSSAVKSRELTEEEEDRAEAKAAMAELDKFGAARRG